MANTKLTKATRALVKENTKRSRWHEKEGRKGPKKKGQGTAGGAPKKKKNVNRIKQAP